MILILFRMTLIFKKQSIIYTCYICDKMESDNQQVQDPLRFIWNITPNSKLQQARSIIHPAFHYTPMMAQSVPKLEYVPLHCSCEAVFNKYCAIDYSMKTIKCCFCGVLTSLPQNYAQAMSTRKMLPYELMPEINTFDYSFKNKKTQQTDHKGKIQDLPLSSSHCYLFAIDLCLLEKQIESVKSSLINILEGFPTDGSKFVGLLTFDKNINVYELASKINTVFCINGMKEYDLFATMDLLGVDVKTDPQNKSYQIFRRFIIQIKNKNDLQKVIRRIRDIKKDRSILVNERHHRSTGQAVSIALNLAESAIVPPRVIFLLGGPCTIGPGTVISSNLKELMRSARDLMNGQNIKYFAQAKKFYDSLIKKVVNKKIIMDLFAFCLEEVGLAQMSELFHSSGGLIVMHEQFSDRIFKQSFKKIFPSIREDSSMNLVTQGMVSITVSKDVSINGALGHCYSLNKSKPFVSDKVIGKGKTNSWYLGSIDSEKSITILYETKQSETKEAGFYIQLKTQYMDEQGTIVTRVLTTQRRWSSAVHEIASGFDQQAAIVYLARYCVHKSLMEEQKNIRQWLDTCLCKWASYFSNYVKGDMASFSLPQTMKSFPQYIYHLRRSSFINRFGSSLDESFYRGYILSRQSPTNCATMIEPVLLKYTIDNPQPEAVALDEEQMQEDVILLLDSYFNIIEWYGQNVQEWFQEKYHEAEGYEHIKDFMQSPKQDIDYIMNTRFPVPNYYLTCPGHSKERYLKSRVNPRKVMGQQNENTLTDDSNLKAFSQHLVKVVTTQSLN